jgi:hypothetical protein
LWWYDGGQPDAKSPHGHDLSNKPPRDLLADIEAMFGEVPGSGYLLIGDKGKIFSDDQFGANFFIKLNEEKKFTHYKKYAPLAVVPQSLPRNPFKGDLDLQHHQEWIAAIKEGKPEMCYSRFAIGAQLTEIMLLGCISLRVGKKIEWDGPNMRALNAAEAAPFIKRNNREGWALA